MEIWAYKKLLGLPVTTPTAAVIFETRSMFTSIRVINKQLKYLHIVLSRSDLDLCKRSMLDEIKNSSGWGVYIMKILDECELPTALEEIISKRRSEWWNLVECATLGLNTKMLLESCKDKGKTRSKTLPITQLLEQDSYRLDYSHNVIFELPRKTVKMIIMARYRMLDCAKNFKGKYGTEYCKECNVVDDESHRLNSCVKWKHVNLYNGGYSIDFSAVFSEDKNTLRLMSRLLRSVWNLENGKNEMRLNNTA